ncbi:MAG: dipeptidase [Pseudohongiellaceae bacterium]
MSSPFRFVCAVSLVSLLTACGPRESPPASQETSSSPQPAMDNPSGTGPSEEEALVARARDIHDRVITIDTHVDINTSNFTADNNYTSDLDVQVNLPKMEAGGLDVAWFIVYTGQDELTEEGFAAAYDNAMDKFGAIHRLADEYAPDRIEVAYNSDDVRRIAAEGKKVAMIGVENGYPLAMELDRVQAFHEMGARYMSLTHNGHNQLGDSNTGERDDVWMHDGLSELGREVVREMNRLGMMIDLSHPSIQTNLQSMELSEAPVIASHSSARALAPSVSRNLTDEELLMLAESGGVVQAVAFRSYLDPEKHERNREALRALQEEIAEEIGLVLLDNDELNELNGPQREEYDEQFARLEELAAPRIEAEVDAIAPPVDVADLVDHIDYMVELIGIDHVGITSDFDGGGGVEGWMNASETFNVTLELVRRGYTEEEIAKLWGENLLRVLDEVQAVAESM